VGIIFIGVYPQPLIVLAQKLLPATAAAAPAASKNVPPEQ
jgi:hypothetical protein